MFRIKVRNKGGECGKGVFLSSLNYLEIGKIKIKPGFRIAFYPEYAGVKNPSPLLQVKDNVIIEYGFTALVADNVTIGANTILASNVSLVSENHGVDVESEIPYYAQPLVTGPISIGEGCWLGQNVVVLPNVIIGKKCVIGANSVVTKNIPPYSIAAGIPARVIKKYDFEKHKWIKV